MFPASDTFSGMIDDVTLTLQGWGATTDQLVTLMGNLTVNSTTFTVDSDTGLSRGVCEVDDELIYVSSVTKGTATVPPWGRGYKSTTASAHTTGAPVAISPTWPRSVVAREINEAILALWPSLWAVKFYSFNLNDSTSWQYALPSDVERVIRVEWRCDALDEWHTVEDWVSTYYNGEHVLVILECIPLSASGRVTYGAIPQKFTTYTDAFSVTGLPVTSKDLVIKGALVRLTPYLDTARLGSEAASTQAMSQTRPLGSALQVTSSLTKMYQARLAEERRALLERYPIRARRVR